MGDGELDIFTQLRNVGGAVRLRDKVFICINPKATAQCIAFDNKDKLLPTMAVGKALDQPVQVRNPMLSAQQDMIVATRLEKYFCGTGGGGTNAPNRHARIVNDEKVGSVMIGRVAWKKDLVTSVRGVVLDLETLNGIA